MRGARQAAVPCWGPSRGAGEREEGRGSRQPGLQGAGVGVRAWSGTPRGSPSSHAPLAALPPRPVSPRRSAQVPGGGAPGRDDDSSPAGPGGPRDRARRPARRALLDGNSDEGAHAGTGVGGARRTRGSLNFSVRPPSCCRSRDALYRGLGKEDPEKRAQHAPRAGASRGREPRPATGLPGTEATRPRSSPRSRESHASQWRGLDIQLVFTEHTTVNQRKLNVYLKPPLKAPLITV